MKAGRLGQSTSLLMKLCELATILRHGLRHEEPETGAGIRKARRVAGWKTRLESFLGEEIDGLLQAGRGCANGGNRHAEVGSRLLRYVELDSGVGDGTLKLRT